MSDDQVSARPVVLVTEDEPLVRMLATDVLTEAGFKVFEAVSADEALTLLAARPDIQALVTDVNMPGSLDGFGLARTVRERWPGVGIIVLSGKMMPGPDDLPEAARFIAKPYPLAVLVREVRALVDPQASEIAGQLPAAAQQQS
jgi:CheY-like chemotaxis protein